MRNRQTSREEENEIDNSCQYLITKHISFRANFMFCYFCNMTKENVPRELIWDLTLVTLCQTKHHFLKENEETCTKEKI